MLITDSRACMTHQAMYGGHDDQDMCALGNVIIDAVHVAHCISSVAGPVR